MTFSNCSYVFARISKVCSFYELTKQFMEVCVKNCAIDLKKNNLYIDENFGSDSMMLDGIESLEHECTEERNQIMQFKPYKYK